MQPADAVNLIKPAITALAPEHWSDLGCGSGTFTRALLTQLPAGSTITAIDQKTQHFPEPEITFYQTDFVFDPLPLGSPEGILLANAFHYVKDKTALIHKLESHFKDVPKFLIIEYDTGSANRWVPFPVSYNKLETFFHTMGYNCTKIGEHPSSFGGKMYAALTTKITVNH